MTQEEKILLFKDLCARLPYGVKVEYNGKVYSLSRPYINFMRIINGAGEEFPSVEKCKPYLRSMSIITDEEEKEYYELCVLTSNGGYDWHYEPTLKSIDWFNSHYLDYRGLIEKGLALEAPKDMYVIKN